MDPARDPLKEDGQMKQYLLSVYHAEGADYAPPADEIQQIMSSVEAFNADLRSTGAWVFAGGLHPSSTATVVRLEGDEVLTTDGPFLEGKEHIGGFWVIKAADLDAALEWGRRATRAARVAVEVRPLQEEAQG
jgi:hypothetical protein